MHRSISIVKSGFDHQTPIHQICKSNDIMMSEITSFSDASWQDCPDTGRSTIGYKIFFQGSLIEWGTSVPVPVAMSSSEAEYMGACTACMAMAHLKMLIQDLKYLGSQDYDTKITEKSHMNILLVDNEATVAMSKNYKPTKKNRHIARRYHYVREGERTQEHHLEWIPAEDQVADDMTKTQKKELISKHVERTLVILPDHMIVK